MMSRRPLGRSRTMLRRSFSLLPNPTKVCAGCAFSLPCLYGGDTIQIKMVPRTRTDNRTTGGVFDIDLDTATTYGEVMDVLVRAVGENPLTQPVLLDDGNLWTMVPYDCPRFNTRAETWGR